MRLSTWHVWSSLLGALALLSAGCASIDSFQTANTLGQGKVQVGLEPSYFGGAGSGGSLALPSANVTARYGITDAIDIGASLGTELLALQAKFQLTDPKQTGFVASLAPTVNGVFFGGGTSSGAAGAGFATFNVPVLLGFGFGDGHQLIIGPRLYDVMLFGGSGSSSGAGNSLMLGTTIGVSLKIADSFRLVPELGVVYPVVSSINSTSGSTAALGGSGVVLYQIGLGVLLGSSR